MKIEVAKPDLEAALQVVSIGTASTGSDLTTHFVFRHTTDSKGNDVVEVLSNNNRLGCSMPVAGCKVHIDGDETAFTVESWRLNKWISAVEDAVLELELKDGNVKATSPKGSVKFQSLDPSQFPYWDETLADTKEGTSIAAKRLHGALSHVKLFISDKDTTTPKLAVTEILNESLQATDKGALAVVTIGDLDSSNLRIHGKDLGQVLAFLGGCDEGVEVREHDRCLFLVRPDGGLLSVGRPHHAFPDIALDKKPDDPHWWSVKTDELQSAINALSASASKEDTRLNFSLDGGMVGLSMTSASGDRVTLKLEAQERGSLDEPPVPMPDGGFDIAYPYLLKLLGQCRDETIKFGLNPQLDKKSGKPKGGWVRFREDRDGDDYLTLLVWLL
jgi:DNA polymerase III sliding clamp (beta) subunit (PCNA family)